MMNKMIAELTEMT